MTKDTFAALVERIKFIATYLDAHAGKFPVPAHVRNDAAFLRDQIAEALGERERLIAWLRTLPVKVEPEWLANAIEAGTHSKGDK